MCALRQPAAERSGHRGSGAATARHEQIDQMLAMWTTWATKTPAQALPGAKGIKQAIIMTAAKRDTEELADELAWKACAPPPCMATCRSASAPASLTQLPVASSICWWPPTWPPAASTWPASAMFQLRPAALAEDLMFAPHLPQFGRAGATGTAIALVGRDDVMPLRRIERLTSHKIRVHEVEGMESRFVRKTANRVRRWSSAWRQAPEWRRRLGRQEVVRRPRPSTARASRRPFVQ